MNTPTTIEITTNTPINHLTTPELLTEFIHATPFQQSVYLTQLLNTTSRHTSIYILSFLYELNQRNHPLPEECFETLESIKKKLMAFLPDTLHATLAEISFKTPQGGEERVFDEYEYMKEHVLRVLYECNSREIENSVLNFFGGRKECTVVGETTFFLREIRGRAELKNKNVIFAAFCDRDIDAFLGFINDNPSAGEELMLSIYIYNNKFYGQVLQRVLEEGHKFFYDFLPVFDAESLNFKEYDASEKYRRVDDVEVMKRLVTSHPNKAVSIIEHFMEKLPNFNRNKLVAVVTENYESFKKHMKMFKLTFDEVLKVAAKNDGLLFTMSDSIEKIGVDDRKKFIELLCTKDEDFLVIFFIPLIESINGTMKMSGGAHENGVYGGNSNFSLVSGAKSVSVDIKSMGVNDSKFTNAVTVKNQPNFTSAGQTQQSVIDFINMFIESKQLTESLKSFFKEKLGNDPRFFYSLMVYNTKEKNLEAFEKYLVDEKTLKYFLRVFTLGEVFYFAHYLANVKLAMKITNLCIKNGDFDESAVLFAFPKMEGDTLPPIFLRTAILSLLKLPTLKKFMVGLCNRMVKKALYKQGDMIDGFLKFIEVLGVCGIECIVDLQPNDLVMMLKKDRKLLITARKFVDGEEWSGDLRMRRFKSIVNSIR